MATDFFGYNRTIGSSSELASSEYAVLSIGSKVNLCQSVNASYQQEIKPVYEVGNASVHYIMGHAGGQIRFARLAGAGKFWSNLSSSNCGQISAVSINSNGSACYAGGGSLNFDGAAVQSVGLNISTGAIEISEEATIMVASMS